MDISVLFILLLVFESYHKTGLLEQETWGLYASLQQHFQGTSQSCVMLDALVIFPLFQSGSTPHDGRDLQSSVDLRLQVDGGPR